MLILLVWVGSAIPAFATHYRAGEITYKLLGPRHYEVTVTTYTDPRQPADVNTGVLRFYWGDGSNEEVSRQRIDNINSKTKRNVYVRQHLYATDGTFLISVTDPNRVENILNINNGSSVNVPFYVESLLRITNTISSNESPVLSVPPIDEGCRGFIYTHNPGAYDPDGDSIYYRLIPPKQAPGLDVPNYSTPANSVQFVLNPQTGQLTWETPIAAGIYNIAIQINEYRRGSDPAKPILVGYVVRDMQIEIRECPNSPPQIGPLPNTCVLAGQEINFTVTASDPNPGQTLTMRAFGGPFEQASNPAELIPPVPTGVGTVAGNVRWKTDCTHIKFFAHQGIIKVNDNYEVQLSDMQPFRIKVVGPAPANLKATQRGNGFDITWDKDSCGYATRYLLYRRIDSSRWTPGNCETGIPASTGFVKIATLDGITSTTFYDDENGNGLSPLINYCYRLVAVFPARDRTGKPIYSYDAEGYASSEICGVIIRSKPIITQVSIRTTDSITGSLIVSWIRPDTIDTLQFPKPYELYFAKHNGDGTFSYFDTISYPDFDAIRDSSFIDTLLDTKNKQYFYKIDLYSVPGGVPEFVDVSPRASSLRAIMYSTDKTNILSWQAAVPWQNVGFVIYRKNESGDFDSIGFTRQDSYSDMGLINNKEYRYKVMSYGKYSLLPDSTLNFSQEINGTPIDTIRPCAPDLLVEPPCNVNFNTFTNTLQWLNKPACGIDIVKYNVYYKKRPSDPTYELLQTLSNQDFIYLDSREILKRGIAGCYVVTGIDSFNNESRFENQVCIDNCPEYRIPNVFSPNGDGKNDLLRPFPYRFIDHMSLKIYNRWGKLVYETTNLDILWDGKDKDSGTDCTNGVYFYVCEVYEQFLEELRMRPIKGSVTLIRE